jgi:hypothetical protein
MEGLTMIRGSCQCEGVQIRLDGVEPRGIKCYCTICRKISGGPYSSSIAVKKGGFHIDQGRDLLVKYNATPTVDRWHCSRCHAPVYLQAPTAEHVPIFVPTGILDPQSLGPMEFDHMFVRSLVPWHQVEGTGAQFDTYPR